MYIHTESDCPCSKLHKKKKENIFIWSASATFFPAILKICPSTSQAILLICILLLTLLTVLRSNNDVWEVCWSLQTSSCCISREDTQQTHEHPPPLYSLLFDSLLVPYHLCYSTLSGVGFTQELSVKDTNTCLVSFLTVEGAHCQIQIGLWVDGSINWCHLPQKKKHVGNHINTWRLTMSFGVQHETFLNISAFPDMHLLFPLSFFQPRRKRITIYIKKKKLSDPR